jgi:hypothetical protein
MASLVIALLILFRRSFTLGLSDESRS